jgi:hypothetical protein
MGIPRPPVSGKAKLTLTVTVTNAKGKELTTSYTLKYLDADPSVAIPPTWRLTKGGGKSSEHYDVHQDIHGWHCSCADYTFNRQNEQKKCKHCEAMKACGLLREIG